MQDGINLKRLILILRRQIRLIAFVVCAFFLLMLIYVTVTPAKYSSEAEILLDKSITATVSDISSIRQMGFEEASVDSEVEIIKSRRITEAVIKSLKQEGHFGNLELSGTAYERSIQKLSASLNVYRVGKTYVLSIGYTDNDPQLAADTANAYADAYIADQFDALSETTNRTSNWLKGKIGELKRQAVDAERAVFDYREQFNRETQRVGADKGPENINSYLKSGAGLSEMKYLEKEVVTYNNILDSYREKLESIAAQSSFPVSETRVITRATAPLEKSHPRVKLLLGAILILGFGFGAILAIIVDNFDRTLRRAGQASQELAMPFLGFFPKPTKGSLKEFKFLSVKGGGFSLEFMPLDLDDPLSAQAGTLRALKGRIDELEGNSRKIIALLSFSSSSEYLNVSTNMASYITSLGKEALVLEAAPLHLKNNTAVVGKLLSNDIEINDHIYKNDVLNVKILPNLLSSSPDIMKFLTPQNVARFFEKIRGQYDYSLLNIPVNAATMDVSDFVENVDGFIIEGMWGVVSANNINFFLKQNRIPADKIIGLVLSNTDMNKMKNSYGHVS